MILLALVLVAQIAYTTADPVDADRLGLATLDGRYSIVSTGCDSLPVAQNALLEQTAVGGYTLTTDQWVCPIEVIAKMSETPCFTNADGICDIAAELDE